MRNRLDELLAEMNEEISKHSQLDDERRQHLQELAGKIEEKLADGELSENSTSQEVPLEDWSLQESLVLFEEEYPRVAALLREIQQVLINIGV